MTAPASSALLTRADFDALRADIAAAVETALDALTPRPNLDDPHGDDRLYEAMRHGVMGGGKRLRAYMAINTARLFGVADRSALRVAAAIECVHAYSLIHDDLPCMDDDDLRRGRPTVHVAYDEATAVLAGDALQALAFEILVDEETHESPFVRCELVACLARAAGARGMVGGQALDLAAETAAAAGRELTLAQITRLQALKTGALFECACEAGAILGKAPAQGRRAAAFYAREFGKAFQIQDDILDAVGNAEDAGKRVGKDAAAGKATFVSAMGLEAARDHARMIAEQAAGHLDGFGASAAPLTALARFALDRKS